VGKGKNRDPRYAHAHSSVSLCFYFRSDKIRLKTHPSRAPAYFRAYDIVKYRKTRYPLRFTRGRTSIVIIDRILWLMTLRDFFWILRVAALPNAVSKNQRSWRFAFICCRDNHDRITSLQSDWCTHYFNGHLNVQSIGHSRSRCIE